MKVFKCEHCGNIITKIVDQGVNIICCGDIMEEVIPNTVEAATEKHLPVINITDNEVIINVGSILHPMESEHHIVFIVIEKENGFEIRNLIVGDEPVIKLPKESLKSVSAYCNLHGLWKTEL